MTGFCDVIDSFTENYDTDFQNKLNKFTCFVCGRIYKYQRSLKRHQVFECDKDGTFQCTLCFYSFKHKSNLERHKKFIHNLFN